MISTHGEAMTSAHYSRMGEQECQEIHLASSGDFAADWRGCPR